MPSAVVTEAMSAARTAMLEHYGELVQYYILDSATGMLIQACNCGRRANEDDRLAGESTGMAHLWLLQREDVAVGDHMIDAAGVRWDVLFPLAAMADGWTEVFCVRALKYGEDA